MAVSITYSPAFSIGKKKPGQEARLKKPRLIPPSAKCINPCLWQVSWLLASADFPAFPARVIGLVTSHLAAWVGSPVTVAGPRRTCTGFPFQPRFTGATIKRYSFVKVCSLKTSRLQRPKVGDVPLRPASLPGRMGEYDPVPSHVLFAHIVESL